MKLPIKFKLDALKGVLGKLGAVKGLFGLFGKKKKKKKKIDEDELDEDDFIPSSSRNNDDGPDEGPDEDNDSGDDPDDEEIPEFDEELTEEEIEEEAQKKKRLIMFGGGGAGAAAILGIIAWLVMAPANNDGDVPDPRVPLVVENLENLEAETFALDQALGRQPLTPSDAGAGQGAGQGADQKKSLNELAAGDAAGNVAPGAGVVVPATTKDAFAALSPAPKGTPLKAAPNYEMIEETDMGMLPRISDKGQTPFNEYSRPYEGKKSDQPRVAVIVSGLGHSRAATDAAINNLPPEISLAIDSYARGVSYWMDRAREVGHEVLLTLPLESATFPFEDPGPGTLRVLSAPEENVNQMEWVMSRGSGFFGLMGVAGSKFTTNDEQTSFMLKAIKDRGIMFVDGGYTPLSLAPRIAFKEKVTWAAVEIDLDKKLEGSKIDLKLAEFEKLATSRSLAIGRISNSPISLARLSAWIKTLPDKGIELVPVSALANKQLIR